MRTIKLSMIDENHFVYSTVADYEGLIFELPIMHGTSNHKLENHMRF